MNPIGFSQKTGMPCLPFSFDINEKDPFSNHSYVELINKQHSLDLPYILGLFYKKKTPYYFDALNLREWTKKNATIADKKMRTLFYFTITKIENQKTFWTYLGHSKEMEYRKIFIDTFFNAAQNDTQAMYDIGDYYSHGFCVLENPEEAIKWWTRSAEKGSIDAQYHLGLCYLCGFDVSKEPSKAHKWLQVALQKATTHQINEEANFFESVEEWENDEEHGKIDSNELISALKNIQKANF